MYLMMVDAIIIIVIKLYSEKWILIISQGLNIEQANLKGLQKSLAFSESQISVSISIFTIVARVYFFWTPAIGRSQILDSAICS